MADFVFNVAKGRVRELVERVDTNDPADAKLILIPLSASDTEANAQDADSVTAALATAMNEQAAGNWGRKTLTDADLTAADYDTNDTANRGESSLPAVSWDPGPTAGNNTTGILICYTEEATPTDAGTIPLVHCDFAVTADGNVVTINAGDFLHSS